MANIHKICSAFVSPQLSAPHPTSGETSPPMVVLSPSVTPEAKPMFLLKKVCPSITIELYGANSENATGIKSTLESHIFVLLTKKNMAGTISRNEQRIIRINPTLSANMPPIKVTTAPVKKRIDKAKLPCAGEEFKTCIQ